MTKRKPPALGWESWIDRQIREAAERGDFRNLPGSGQPLPGLDRPYDENWWAKQKLRSEGLTYQSPSLALRRDAQNALDESLGASSEEAARDVIEAVNARIRDANRRGIPGPPTTLVPCDVERVLELWRSKHSKPSSGSG